MATLNDFLPDVEKEAPGCGVPDAKRAIRRAIADLCTETHWWAETLATTVPLVAGTDTYTLTPPANAAVVAPVKLWIVDVTPEIPFKTRQWLDRYLPGWDFSSVTGQRVPAYAFSPGPGKVTFYPPPNAESVADGLEVSVRAALSPARTAETIDDRFLNDADAVEAIRAGALMRLLDTAQGWGNIPRARQEEQRFQAYVGQFKTKVMLAGADGILTAETGGSAYY